MSAVAAVTSAVNPVGDDARWRLLAEVAGWISVVAFADYTDARAAAAFAAAQQLVSASWNVVSMILLSVVGWMSGARERAARRHDASDESFASPR